MVDLREEGEAEGEGDEEEGGVREDEEAGDEISA